MVPLVVTLVAWGYQVSQFMAPGTKYIGYFGTVFLDHLEFSGLIILVGIFSFYVSYLVLIPVFVKPKRYLIKVLLILVLLIGPFAIVSLMSLFVFAVSWFYTFFLISGYIASIPFIFFGAFLGMMQYWKKQEVEKIRLEKQALALQLSMLKSRFNPHFLFNTINNIDILIESNPSMASKYLHKLSELLRFMLVKNEEETVFIEEAINGLEQYIDLQRLRSNNPDFVQFNFSKQIEKPVKIAPLLFMIFVENAFKYVADKQVDRAINIDIQVNKALVSFTCQNTIAENQSLDSFGLGLKIIKKRLNLLYPNRHQLQIEKSENIYKVRLNIIHHED